MIYVTLPFNVFIDRKTKRSNLTIEIYQHKEAHLKSNSFTENQNLVAVFNGIISFENKTKHLSKYR